MHPPLPNSRKLTSQNRHVILPLTSPAVWGSSHVDRVCPACQALGTQPGTSEFLPWGLRLREGDSEECVWRAHGVGREEGCFARGRQETWSPCEASGL